VRLLAPLGAAVHVRSPATVRAALARLGEEPVETHGAGTGTGDRAAGTGG